MFVHLFISQKSRKGWTNSAEVWLLNQRACYFLSDHSWLKFHQIIGFLLRPQYLHIADWEGGGSLLKFGPVGNLGSSQRLSSSLFHRPAGFRLFQRQKDEKFSWAGRPLGPTTMIEDKIRLAFPLVTSQGDRDKDRKHFLRDFRGNQHISANPSGFLQSDIRT